MSKIFTKSSCLMYGLLVVACFSTTYALVDGDENKPHGTGWNGYTDTKDIQRDYGIDEYCMKYVPYHIQAVECQTLVEVKSLKAELEQLKQDMIVHHDSWGKLEQQKRMEMIP